MMRRIDVLTSHSALPEADWLTGLRTWIGAAVQRAAARA
jgi:hypothetical protein